MGISAKCMEYIGGGWHLGTGLGGILSENRGLGRIGGMAWGGSWFYGGWLVYRMEVLGYGD